MWTLGNLIIVWKGGWPWTWRVYRQPSFLAYHLGYRWWLVVGPLDIRQANGDWL